MGKGAFTLNVRDKVRGNFVRHNRIDKLIIRDLRYRTYLQTLQSNESLSLSFYKINHPSIHQSTISIPIMQI